MSYKPKPAIWSCDTGQRIPCFDRCQLIITWMSNLSEKYTVNQGCMSLSSYYLDYSRHVAQLRCCRAIPLVMKTMRISIHGFPFASHMGMGLRLVAFRAAGALLLNFT